MISVKPKLITDGDEQAIRLWLSAPGSNLFLAWLADKAAENQIRASEKLNDPEAIKLLVSDWKKYEGAIECITEGRRADNFNRIEISTTT